MATKKVFDCVPVPAVGAVVPVPCIGAVPSEVKNPFTSYPDERNLQYIDAIKVGAGTILLPPLAAIICERISWHASCISNCHSLSEGLSSAYCVRGMDL